MVDGSGNISTGVQEDFVVGGGGVNTKRIHLEPLIGSSSMLNMCVLQPAY